MVKEYLRYLMEESMKEDINLIKNMDMECLLGRMEEAIEVSGLKENATDKVII